MADGHIFFLLGSIFILIIITAFYTWEDKTITFCHTATNTLYFEATKTPVYDMEGYPANCDVELLERLEGLSDDGKGKEGVE